jgi:hypothetical protein
MAWQPLSNRLPNLPIVLAGPILRRVTPDSVTVWLALKEQKTVTLEVYDRSNALRLIGSRQSVAVGKNLHIVAVTAEQGTGELVPGQNYTYNIMLNDGRDLSSPGVIDDSIASISYPPFSLPSFSLPPANLEQLRLVHGSCRKPHGPSLDAMEGLEIMLVESIADPHKRPHQLFLTGDQIYADDVADAMLFMLIDAGDATVVRPRG